MIQSIDSRILFTGLVGLVAVMRLVELAISRRNIARLRKRGAVEIGRSHYPVMVAVHTLFLGSCVAEVWLAERPLIPVLASFSLGLLVGAAVLRWWVMRTLGERWSTRVMILPETEPVSTGPFRRMRHPNYLAVVIEFGALPMVHTAWLTAVLFGLANAAVLARRIRIEEAGLRGSSSYDELLGDRPPLVPGPR
jgi:methyltransferase